MVYLSVRLRIRCAYRDEHIATFELHQLKHCTFCPNEPVFADRQDLAEDLDCDRARALVTHAALDVDPRQAAAPRLLERPGAARLRAFEKAIALLTERHGSDPLRSP